MKKNVIKYVVKKGKKFFCGHSLNGSSIWTTFFDDAQFFSYRVARELSEHYDTEVIQLRIMIME